MGEDNEKFEVKDRRKALLDEEEESPGAVKPEEPPKQEERKEEAAGQKEALKGPSAGQGGMPPLDFIAFIGSLGASALMHLGEKLSPEQPEMEVNLPAAQQMIDLLDMLKVKTAGNLSQEEQASLDNLLYNLKIRFAHASSVK